MNHTLYDILFLFLLAYFYTLLRVQRYNKQLYSRRIMTDFHATVLLLISF